LTLLQKIVFRYKITTGAFKARRLLFFTLLFKRCYYGPFKGEFGHLLAHNLPFIAYLHSKGVKIRYCGIELHKPFFIDEKGEPLVSEYTALDDFFMEAQPDSNKVDEPARIRKVTLEFIRKAKRSFLPFWNMNDETFYWYTFRWWTVKHSFMKTNDLSKSRTSRKESSVVIFPRKKGPATHVNNGEAWDYKELAEAVSPYFDKVYVIGHPAFSSEFDSFGKIEVCIAPDNKMILEKCCKSSLIITPHSGTVYLGEYTDCPVLIIYKGGNVIGNIEETKKFKLAVGNRYPFSYAFNMEEIVTFIKNLNTI